MSARWQEVADDDRRDMAAPTPGGGAGCPIVLATILSVVGLIVVVAWVGANLLVSYGVT